MAALYVITMGWMPCFSITLGTHGIPGPLIQGSLVEKENLDRKKMNRLRAIIHPTRILKRSSGLAPPPLASLRKRTRKGRIHREHGDSRGREDGSATTARQRQLRHGWQGRTPKRRYPMIAYTRRGPGPLFLSRQKSPRKAGEYRPEAKF